MTTIRAKFRCESVIDTKISADYSNRVVKFRAVYGQEGENASYAKATPNGTLEMQIDKDTAAYDHFQPGKSYYLDLVEAE